MDVVRFSLDQAVYPEYASYSNRLATFEGWPIGIPLTAQELTDAGFIYTNFRDHTLCYYCGIRLGRWEEGDCAYQEHRRWSPWCEYIRMLFQDGLAANCSNHQQQKSAAEEEEAEEKKEEKDPVCVAEPLLCKICLVNPLCIVFMPCRQVLHVQGVH